MSDEINININILVIIGVTGEPEEIELTAPEAAIVKYCQRWNGDYQLSTFYSEFYQYSRPEIIDAVSRLRSKNILLDSGYGYYTLNKSMNCMFAVKDTPKKRVHNEPTDEEKAEVGRKKTSDEVKKLWREEKTEGEKRSKLLEECLNCEIERKKKDMVSKAKQQLSQELEEIVTKLEDLSLFAFKAKFNCKKTVKKLRYDLEHLEESDLVAPKLKKLRALAKQCVSDYNNQIAEYLNTRYIVESIIKTINPLDYYNCVSGNVEEDNTNREILSLLRVDSYSIDELADMLNVYSQQKFRFFITRLRKYELIELDFDKPDDHYGYKLKLRRQFVEEKIECWKENPKMKHMLLPPIPNIEIVLQSKGIE